MHKLSLITALRKESALRISDGWSDNIQIFKIESIYIVYSDLASKKIKAKSIYQKILGTGKCISIESAINKSIYELMERYLCYAPKSQNIASSLRELYIDHYSPIKIFSTTTGCALGSSISFAAKAAYYELQERLSLYKWWYLSSFEHDVLSREFTFDTIEEEFKTYLEKTPSLFVSFRRIYTDNLKVVLMISRETPVIMGAGCSHELRNAVHMSLLEHAQMQVAQCVGKNIGLSTEVTQIKRLLNNDVNEFTNEKSSNKKSFDFDYKLLGEACIFGIKQYCVRAIPCQSEIEILNNYGQAKNFPF